MYPSQRQPPEHHPAHRSPHLASSPSQTPASAHHPYAAPHPGPPLTNVPPHSPQAHLRSQPPSPTATRASYPRDRSSSGYYDPIMESRQRPPIYDATYVSPRERYQGPPAYGPPIDRGDRGMDINGGPPRGAPMNGNAPGPYGHPPPPLPLSYMPQSVPYLNGGESLPPGPPPIYPAKVAPSPAPARASNPMSMSNLLSDDAPAPPVPAPLPASIVMSSPKPIQHNESRTVIEPPQPPPQPPLVLQQQPVKTELPIAPPPQSSPPQHSPRIEKSDRKSFDAVAPAPEPTPPATTAFPPEHASGPPDLSVRRTEAAYAEIEAGELSDVEQPGFEAMQGEWRVRSQKRSLEIVHQESIKRKRRRQAALGKYEKMFAISSDAAKELFVVTHNREAEEEVRNKDVEEEKERKKDMQRKRRRERTLQNETAKRDEAMNRLQHLEDEEERLKILKDVQKAGKKIKNTEDLLQGKAISKEEESPSDAVLDAQPDEPEVKTRRGKGTRPRKSKEQKLAEKESAAAAQAALDRGDELPEMATKEEELPVVEAKPRKAPPVEVTPYSSKGYNQIYEQIWKDLAKNHVNKVHRIRITSLDTKQSNLRKTAQLAAKEARRWQLRTNKGTKDIQARAKRSMREMLSFWKRNERDERDQRKMAEKQELENARKAEADREAARQKRKLNFLISQTELYSHFIGKKVKTDELERSGNDAIVSTQKTTDDPQDAHTTSNANPATKVTNFEDLDFDAEDETALQQAAMANAQIAVQEAQDRARAFNNEAPSQFDDGEMNFQNPTSLQSMDIEQPKMLTCKLKEYQLKGLNWLVNLYEQGINGILADEMGLGKTVQSISVMAYLAEVHNIWGPFLVIAPASTLHNWQQEITKFVPTLKVLPYWGNAKDRKVLRKFWDRKHITYSRDSSFHVLITSYQLVVQDTAYFQKIRWQYMILDEAQAIKSSQSSRWKALLGFHCRNRLLLTGTPIQNNMQELWALLHFIMPSLFDSHDEFSDWFSKDIESHAQSNTKLNEDQLKRLHMILKPFMLRRVKKHVQKELGDKVEEDVFCDLSYRQRAYYTNLRNKISLMDLIEKAAAGDDQDMSSLINLVMQFRKVCNHPDLFERADITSPLSLSTWAETASFMREGFNVQVPYSVKSSIEYWIPKRLISGDGRLDLVGPENDHAGWRNKYLQHLMSIYDPEHVRANSANTGAFSWLRFVDASAGDISKLSNSTLAERIVGLERVHREGNQGQDLSDEHVVPAHAMLNIVKPATRRPLAEVPDDGYLQKMLNISRFAAEETGYNVIETCTVPRASAPPVELICPDQESLLEKENAFFNVPIRRALYPISASTELALLHAKIPRSFHPVTNLLPAPGSDKQRYTKIKVPSMRQFVSDCGKLAKLDELLKQLKAGGHRVLLYFQMTRMIDLMEEYLTYRNYKYCRLDGSTKLEDRRDTVAAFQATNEIFVFLLSTRAGGLGINLTAADTVIFYDSDWNPTIDSQAMDRAHRLGQTRQVTVYRLITRGTIEERIRKRALQKEEVQRVVISGGAPAGGSSTVDFSARKGDNRTKDIALWLADDDQAAEIEKKEAEMLEQEAKDPTRKRRRDKTTGGGGRKKEISMDDMYHEGEGRFDDDGGSNKPSGAATPAGGATDDATAAAAAPPPKKKRISKKAKTIQQRLAVADGQVDGGF